MQWKQQPLTGESKINKINTHVRKHKKFGRQQKKNQTSKWVGGSSFGKLSWNRFWFQDWFYNDVHQKARSLYLRIDGDS